MSSKTRCFELFDYFYKNFDKFKLSTIQEKLFQEGFFNRFGRKITSGTISKWFQEWRKK